MILYFTADYPSTEILKSFLEAVDPDVVKYVEIGIPESNPLYDGPTIKATHSLALRNYKPTHLAEYTGILDGKGIPVFALSYYEKFNKLGSGYATFLKDAGFSGVIIPDLLTDYSEESDRIIPEIEEIFSFIPFPQSCLVHFEIVSKEFKEICTSLIAGGSKISMLGNLNAHGAHNKGRSGAHIDCILAVSACAHNI